MEVQRMQQRLSDTFIARLKTTKTPAYRICAELGLSPFWLSRVLRGAIEVTPDDTRIIAIGKRLGLRANQVWGP